MTLAIDVRGINKHFGDKHVVRDLALQVKQGEIFGFLGPNGSGKTTSIRMICGLLTPDSGEGTCLGFDVLNESVEIKKHVGYMTQKFSLWDDLTIAENLDFVARMFDMKERKQAVSQALEELGLTARRDQLAGTLSGGWKQRLALGCAVLHEPPILFLDEPTSGVDPISRRQFWDLIYTLSGQGVTVFVTTHYMEESEYCDRLGIVYRGELIASGTPRALKTEHMTEAVLELDCAQPNEAMAVLERLPEVKEVAVFGKGLHAVAADPAAAETAIRAALAAGGFRLDRLERIVPTLEDVFVSLIEARDRAAGAQQEFAR